MVSLENKPAKPEAFNKLPKTRRVTTNVELSLNVEAVVWIMTRRPIGPILSDVQHNLHAICDARHRDGYYPIMI